MKTAVFVPTILVVAGIACTPSALADPPVAHEFHGLMIAKHGTVQVHAELLDDPGGQSSTMTAGSCVQDWRITQSMGAAAGPGTRRAFATSDVISGQSDWCQPSSNLGLTFAEPNSPYSLHNGHWNLNVMDQGGAVVDTSWVMDSDVSV
jgi:hypothetical protein